MLEFNEDDAEEPLSRDTPCVRCGHTAHPFLACGDGCDCAPTPMPGQEPIPRT
jgi:hypothetical protein